MTEPVSTAIFIDADACPVKEEVYKVAARYGFRTHVVANTPLRVPRDPSIALVVVDAGPDVADDWIADRAGPRDIVVTADIPLADRCLKAGAIVLAPNGKAFTPDSIGMAIAHRSIMEQLRSTGDGGGGPKPFSPQDRSRFLSALDQAASRLRRR